MFDVPARLDPATTHAIGQDALRLFRELGCAGLLRVDFFLLPDGTRVVNEVNTFPGFTSVSQYPRMWQAAGLDYRDLLDVLVDTALAHHAAGRGARDDRPLRQVREFPDDRAVAMAPSARVVLAAAERADDVGQQVTVEAVAADAELRAVRRACSGS